MRITEVCIRNPVLAWMLMAAVVLSGLVAASRIGVSQFPNIDVPTLGISVTWEGAAPEVVETDVVEPLEEALTQVEGVRSIRSTARQGSASITLELDLARNIDAAFQDVQAKISQTQRRLPKDIDPPTISKSNLDDAPILFLALTGTATRQELSDVARYRIKERLQTVPGVGEIFLGGFQERNVRIWLDLDRLDGRGLTVAEVIAALQREHVELPAGQMSGGDRELNLRVLGEALDLDALRALTVARRGGVAVRLDEVALVEDGFQDRRGLARMDGAPAQGIGVRKQRGANAVAVADGVIAACDVLRRDLPPTMSLLINFDSTTFIKDSVHHIEWELLMAAVLTGLLCWLFLGSLSSTLNVVLAIPMSLLGTITVLYFTGCTLNTFTLLGLGLAVGLVVDDAIMVLENITRHREEGASQVQAARVGTREIAFAALASSIAIVAVFSPVLFMGGMIGRFFLQFGIALCVAILLSYLEAVTLAPARCAQFLAVGAQRRTRIGRLADAAFTACEHGYSRVLAIVLRRPVTVLVVAAVLFLASLAIVRRLPGEMIPAYDQGLLIVRFDTPVGSSLEETDRLLRHAEARLQRRPEVQRSMAIIGGMGGGGGVNGGMIFVTLTPASQRPSQAEVMGILRRELGSIPGFTARIQDMGARAFTGSRGSLIDCSLRGPDWATLQQAGRELQERMRASGAFVDIDSDLEFGMPELAIHPDRERCADVGVPVETVAATINALAGGVKVGKFSDGSRRLDMRLRLLADQRTRPEDLGRLTVRAPSGELLPLSSLITRTERPAQKDIRRADRERAVGVSANLAPGQTQAQAMAMVESWAADLPTGVRLVFTGASQTMQESSAGIIFAFIGGLLAAYMVLASQFNSFLMPVTVMLPVLPLSITGAVVALWLGGQSFNLFSGIGILLLLGIAKKNSIILVDYTNQLRGEKHGHLDVLAALQRACPVRLRPILMTSLATMAAAVPMALGLGSGSEVRRPMAIAVLGGLAVSTALSLVVVPAFYLVVEGWRERRRQRRADSPQPCGDGP